MSEIPLNTAFYENEQVAGSSPVRGSNEKEEGVLKVLLITILRDAIEVTWHFLRSK